MTALPACVWGPDVYCWGLTCCRGWRNHRTRTSPPADGSRPDANARVTPLGEISESGCFGCRGRVLGLDLRSCCLQTIVLTSDGLLLTLWERERSWLVRDDGRLGRPTVVALLLPTPAGRLTHWPASSSRSNVRPCDCAMRCAKFDQCRGHIAPPLMIAPSASNGASSSTWSTGSPQWTHWVGSAIGLWSARFTTVTGTLNEGAESASRFFSMPRRSSRMTTL